MRLFPQKRRSQRRNVGVSPLASSLGFTCVFTWGGGESFPQNKIGANNALAYLTGTFDTFTSPSGLGIGFSGALAQIGAITLAGNPFATSTGTWMFVESGVDVSASGQAIITTGTAGGLEQPGALQLRIVGADIQIIAANTAIELTATGARRNNGQANCWAASVAGNSGRHAVFGNGKLIASATPAVTYVHGAASGFGGGAGVPMSTVQVAALFFAPKVIPDSVLIELTKNPWQLFALRTRDFTLNVFPDFLMAQACL